MISPKEEAEELVSSYRKEILKGKYRVNGFVVEALSEECALIAVDRILKVAFFAHDDIYNHYLEVKIELEKI